MYQKAVSLGMDIEYSKYRTRDGTFYRPTLDVIFRYKSAVLPYEAAIVDTGSDFIMLPLDIAEVLEAEPDFEQVTELHCACGGTFRGYASRYPIEIIIDQKGFRPVSWKTHVRFVEAKVSVLLGHRGFLDRFNATFHGKQHTMTLSEQQSGYLREKA